MESLIIGISGVRGIVGETLTPELLTRLGSAFGTYMDGGKVVIGRDTRTSGEMVKYSVLGGLLSTGCEIIDIDICTTPSCQIMIRELNADGGVVISGSHNPAQWNALKFFRKDAIYLNDSEGKQLLNIYYQGDFIKARWDEIRVVRKDERTIEKHLRKVLANADVNLIRKRKLKVALDSCNGAGSIITPELLKRLGCETVKIHCEPSGFFPHNPEPVFINLADLSAKVSESGADIGFAQDADADRLAIISEKGDVLGEEYSLCLAAEFMLRKKKGIAVTNLSTTRAMDDIVRKYSSRLIRTKVGEVNVAETMEENRAVIGGEGNGGIIDPRVHYGRDSLAGIALILQYMAETGKRISELAEEVPKYYIEKRKILCSRGESNKVLELVKEKYKKEKMDLSDGIKIDWEDSWVHMRSSNTEPVMRIITESRSKRKSEQLNDRITAEIESILKVKKEK